MGRKEVRFCSFDFSTVDMPLDTADGSDLSGENQKFPEKKSLFVEDGCFVCFSALVCTISCAQQLRRKKYLTCSVSVNTLVEK